jgi:hypothetical protein
MNTQAIPPFTLEPEIGMLPQFIDPLLIYVVLDLALAANLYVVYFRFIIIFLFASYCANF